MVFLGHYNQAFSKDKQYLFNTNTLSNAEAYLRNIHYLDQGGDI